MTEITFPRPDDLHLHVRDAALMASVVPHTARQFARALMMPNLKPPVTSVAQALTYRERIRSSLPNDLPFSPLMALYLTDNTAPSEIDLVAETPEVLGLKYYPAGATTNSDAGVSALSKVYPVLARMQHLGVPLMLHGEVTEASVDVFDKEARFVDTLLQQIHRDFPALRLVLEHITTTEAAQFVAAAPAHVAATITPQHLLYNRNAIFKGGIRPHYYCLPILKRESHRQSLLQAVASGSSKYFLGTDSAPHLAHTKENACGCAGCFTAHAALELYAEAFEEANALPHLAHFASRNGAAFYGLPVNSGTVTLRKETWTPESSFDFGDGQVVPLRAGEPLAWKMVGYRAT
jgi:dihydroorotase